MDALEIEDIEIALFLQAIRRRHGYDFEHYARASLTRRVRKVAADLGHARISDLASRVVHDDACLAAVIAGLSVPVSEFFRDPEAFGRLRADVVPMLRSHPRVNVWVAGCATGEEAYSLAILLREEGLLPRTQIYATDINEVALRAAEEGRYPADRMPLYARNHQQAGGASAFADHFRMRDGHAVIDESLRDNLIFSHHNLVSDGVFCEVQLLMCRNVLIYFDRELQRRVFGLFDGSLARGGFLCLGVKESPRFPDAGERYEAIDGRLGIHRKRTMPEDAP